MRIECVRALDPVWFVFVMFLRRRRSEYVVIGKEITFTRIRRYPSRILESRHIFGKSKAGSSLGIERLAAMVNNFLS